MSLSRKKAKELINIVSNEDLKEMLENAKKNISDWTKTSSINRSMTIGVSWNILGENFNVEERHSDLGKINMIREFGEFLPEKYVTKNNKASNTSRKITHQEPKFKTKDDE